MVQTMLKYLLGAGVVLASGCSLSYTEVHTHREPQHVYVRRTPPPVVVVHEEPRVVHVHSHDCGHVWDGHAYLYVKGHVHGPGCGHDYDGHRWVVVRKDRGIGKDRAISKGHR